MSCYWSRRAPVDHNIASECQDTHNHRYWYLIEEKITDILRPKCINPNIAKTIDKGSGRAQSNKCQEDGREIKATEHVFYSASQQVRRAKPAYHSSPRGHDAAARIAGLGRRAHR